MSTPGPSIAQSIGDSWSERMRLISPEAQEGSFPLLGRNSASFRNGSRSSARFVLRRSHHWRDRHDQAPDARLTTSETKRRYLCWPS